MTTDDRLSEAERLFELPPNVLLKRGRTRRVAAARNAVMWALRDAGWTTVAIGMLFGRDHTTVISNIHRAEHDALENAHYALQLAALR